MSYLHDRKKDHRKKQFYIGLGIAVFVVLLSVSGVFSFITPFFHMIARPFWKADNAVVNSINNLGYVVRTKASVYRENESLTLQNKDLQNRMLDYDVLAKDNLYLKELFGRVDQKEEFVLGTILAKPNQSPYDTLIIDIGTNEGIYVGQEVYANAIVPLGTVSSVYAHTAVVKLYSNPGEITEAQIEGTNASVQLTGRGGGNFEMMIPKDLEVPTGSTVILPNNKSRIVAIVADRISDVHDPMNKVILRSPINIQELKWVELKK